MIVKTDGLFASLEETKHVIKISTPDISATGAPPGDEQPPDLDVRGEHGHGLGLQLVAVQVDADPGGAGLHGRHVLAASRVVSNTRLAVVSKTVAPGCSARRSGAP